MLTKFSILQFWIRGLNIGGVRLHFGLGLALSSGGTPRDARPLDSPLTLSVPVPSIDSWANSTWQVERVTVSSVYAGTGGLAVGGVFSTSTQVCFIFDLLLLVFLPLGAFLGAWVHLLETCSVDLQTEHGFGADGHLLVAWPISLQSSHTGGIHGLDTRTLLISPESNWTLTASGSGFLGSMTVKTFATSKFVLFAVAGCRN